jgi:predicted SnoaL-like aldol condensation-catalyzing enzyme
LGRRRYTAEALEYRRDASGWQFYRRTRQSVFSSADVLVDLSHKERAASKFKWAAGILLAFSSVAFAGMSDAQERVVGVKNPDSLFVSKDPVLHRNKQAAYRIIKDLLEANQWQDADKYLTERYIQHNPLALSGRQGVVDFFVKVMGRKPTPMTPKMRAPVVAVVAEGDLVVVTYPREMTDPKDPTKKYTTTWFDQWRFVDG